MNWRKRVAVRVSFSLVYLATYVTWMLVFVPFTHARVHNVERLIGTLQLIFAIAYACAAIHAWADGKKD